MHRISFKYFIDILLESDYPVLFLGSGYDYIIGYMYYYDYRSYGKIDLAKKSLICREFDENILNNYKIIMDMLKRDIFKSLITSSPYCLYRCCHDIEKDIVKNQVISLLGCVECMDCPIDVPFQPIRLGEKIDHKLLIKALTEITVSDLLVIGGFNPVLSPVNLLPMITRYGRGRIVLVETNYNPYLSIADYWLQMSLPKALINIHDLLCKNKLIS